jgi:prephenate dehydrogenase
MKTVAIFGVGLIGGSFALALRRAGFSGRILGVSSQKTLQRALELHVIDRAASGPDAARSADLIYLAQPILRIVELLPELDQWVNPDALITDAGSTKKIIVDRAAQTISRCQFLGGHPMAGREKFGVEAAEAGLFEGRPYVLTPRLESEMQTPAVKSLIDWIRRIGAKPVTLDAEEHDRAVAYTSHLPQLASTALAAMLDGRSEPQAGVFGPALIDSTRLSLSSFEMWRDIFATNRETIQDALGNYIATLEEFRRNLEPEPMRSAFDRAARFARQIRDARNASGEGLAS